MSNSDVTRPTQKKKRKKRQRELGRGNCRKAIHS